MSRRTPQIEKICKGCGCTFTVLAYDKRRYCSNECREQHYGSVMKTCPFCGKEFKTYLSANKQYCSRECLYSDPNQKALHAERTKAAWQKDDVRERIMKGIEQRSKSDEWKSAPHFQKGINHPRYKGERRERTRAMAQYEYKKWRTDVFKRDGYTCQECGKRGGKLTVHHIQHWSTHPDLRYEVSNGITLCEVCHDAKHGWKRRPKTYHCVDCGVAKTDGSSPRCHSCASKHGFRDDLRVKDKPCEFCGKMFKPLKRKARFCCPECRALASRKRAICTCANCGQQFERYPYEVKPIMFCSVDCYKQSRSK